MNCISACIELENHFLPGFMRHSEVERSDLSKSKRTRSLLVLNWLIQHCAYFMIVDCVLAPLSELFQLENTSPARM
ncbi:hypothetical protein SCHPADRAFT_535220 [Schizopora paradoxa]|uniref:Uncharacterized protein n=1 Tax=Schizopora paradoxa TaxID=27342 RepID=A0A0H2RE65_9AGAM|nr:hypothetical protein SCHPADRAFT_535220 [Schizopora paradoxa]